MRRRGLLLVVIGVSLAAAGASWGANVPQGVSPGGSRVVSLIEARCPTFSWGAVAGAGSYELAVYRIGEDGTEAQAVLDETISGSALSWTPALDKCLTAGGRYAWSIRAVGGAESSSWSPPNLFQVAAGSSADEFQEALVVVRRYLAVQGGTAGESEGPSKGKPSSVSLAARRAAERSTAPQALGGADFSVDGSGNVEAASFAGRGAALAYGTVRYDGTLGFGPYNIDSVSWNSSLSRYEISITDFYYSIGSVTVATVSGDAGSCPGGASARQSSVGGKLLIYIVDKNGVNRQCSFRFVSYAFAG